MTPEDLKKLLVNQGFHPDDGIATHLIHACQVSGLSLSDALTLIEGETGFKNVFGHDPTTSIPDSWKGSKVTWAKYKYYKLRRGAHGLQGVGPGQLTWGPTQDLADKEGGAHKPYPNMLVAFRTLHSNISRLGRERGAAAYNGTGPAAVAYGKRFKERQQHWHRLVS